MSYYIRSDCVDISTVFMELADRNKWVYTRCTFLISTCFRLRTHLDCPWSPLGLILVHFGTQNTPRIGPKSAKEVFQHRNQTLT